MWNFFLLLLSYMLVVIIENVFHFFWRIAGVEPSDHWMTFAVCMMIEYPIIFIICGWISKKAREIKKKKIFVLPPRIIAVAGADLLLCMIVFTIHITITNQAGSAPQLLVISIGLYVAYFVLTFVMVTMIIREYQINAQITMKQNSYDNLQEYMTQIEALYQNIRAFRHDYANIMASMAVYLRDNDIEGLKVYYEKHIFPANRLLNQENDVISRLNKLDLVELKGLIAVKINYALEMHIRVGLEITERIEKINMNRLDLVRIAGILLDNAIEACQECEEPGLDLAIIKTPQGVTIIIRNNYIKKKIDYSRLGNPGVTSKGERRGIGLYNMKSLIGNYDNVVMDTEYEDLYFTQLIEIYEENQEGMTFVAS